MSAITGVFAWEALDSRGTPTVACEVTLATGAKGAATVPSGASTGTHEARELRDGGERYGGKGVQTAVANACGPLAQAVTGLEAADQAAVDQALCAADGTAALARLGANAVLAISVATVLAVAADTGQPLFRLVAGAGAEPLLPMPMVNILSGGAHAGGAIDIQDVLAVPVGARSFAEAIEWACRVRRATAELVADRGLVSSLVADEGGLGPTLKTNREALEIVAGAIELAKLEPGEEVAIGLDVAATQLFAHDGYRLKGEHRRLTSDQLVDELAEWARDFPIVSIEDPLSEDDWEAWKRATMALGGLQLVGDDLFATNGERLGRGIESEVANAVLVKPNQIGTLSAARLFLEQAEAADYATVLSARSGETEDVWLADLAVGWRVGQIKVGSTTRSERTSKWNRLLRIEAELGEGAAFARWPARSG